MKVQKNKRLEQGKEEREKWIEKERMDRGQMKRRLLERKTRTQILRLCSNE